MKDTYTFADDTRGTELCKQTRDSLASQGITSEITQETWEEDVEVLILTVTGKRPGEGKIAADMKARKHAL